MRCYYEELGVGRDANESEIKSAYRKLALKWHPDKNPDSIEAAKERFQLLQQAYEVLCDPQERAWYDNHREQILRGKNSDYEDNCLDVFQYFTVSCFKGYGDDDKGFYAIYREVFEKISAEDIEFMDCEEEMLNIPKFGDSKSSYEDVVGPFYAHWSAYCTKRTYTWLCPYNIKDIKDRRILREIEKDMKKVAQKAKKERNEEVRNLVSFVRKRDKRVQAYKKLLEQRSAFNRQKQEQNRLDQIRRRQQEVEEMKQNSQTANDDYEEQLKQLEQEYSSDDECYENQDKLVEEENLGNDNYIDGLYCVACNKDFKTEKSFANHELSRKHRDNIERLKIEMQGEESLYQEEKNFLGIDDIEIQVSEEAHGIKNLEDSKNQSVATKNKSSKTKNNDLENIKKLNRLNLIEENDGEVAERFDILDNNEKDDEDWDTANKKTSRKLKNKNKAGKSKTNLFDQKAFQPQFESESVSKTKSKTKFVLKSEITEHICATCKSKFESKNKLFSHIKLTNHGVFIPKTKENCENTKSKKVKGKTNS